MHSAVSEEPPRRIRPVFHGNAELFVSFPTAEQRCGSPSSDSLCPFARSHRRYFSEPFSSAAVIPTRLLHKLCFALLCLQVFLFVVAFFALTPCQARS